jgi:putative membrane protein (TIGR04086 family)
MYKQSSYGNEWFSVLKSVGVALLISFFSSLVFAVILRASSGPEKIIYPVNQTVKVVAILIGVLLFLRGEKGWLRGGVAGLLFTALSYLAFSALGGDFSLSWLIFVELFFALAAGGIGGIIAVNIRR